jgi:hypothetical protein
MRQTHLGSSGLQKRLRIVVIAILPFFVGCDSNEVANDLTMGMPPVIADGIDTQVVIFYTKRYWLGGMGSPVFDEMGNHITRLDSIVWLDRGEESFIWPDHGAMPLIESFTQIPDQPTGRILVKARGYLESRTEQQRSVVTHPWRSFTALTIKKVLGVRWEVESR